MVSSMCRYTLTGLLDVYMMQHLRDIAIVHAVSSPVYELDEIELDLIG